VDNGVASGVTESAGPVVRTDSIAESTQRVMLLRLHGLYDFFKIKSTSLINALGASDPFK
jgi:hypothetical protein